MSDIKDQTEEHLKKIAEQKRIKDDAALQRAQYDSKLYASKIAEQEREEKELELAKKANYGALSAEEVAQTVKDNQEYMEASKHPMMFINRIFDKLVPFFRKNLILFAGQTGEGKSTAVVNLAYSALGQRNPKTGKLLRTLIITNEEKREDLYNRVTCLHKGWHYTNHSSFTDEQRAEFDKMIPVFSSGGRLTIIDDCHGGSQGVTTSIEGLEAIFQSLIEKKEYYDIVIIDYYQNFIHSKTNPGLDMYKVQERVSGFLNNVKNMYPAPIVVMAQLKPFNQDAKDRPPFQTRLMGSKSIMVPCTFAAEMVIDRKNLRTKIVVHKSRYTEAFSFKDFWVGYDKGKFVEYTTAFADKVQAAFFKKEEYKLNQTIDKTNGIKNVFKSEEKKEEGK
jgi:hypothetical protein